MFLDIHRSQTNSVGFGVSSSRQSRKRTPKPDFHSNKDHKRFVTVFESVLSSTPDTPPMHSVTSSRHYIIMHRRRHISYIKVTCFESSLSFAGIAMGRSIGEEETFNCGVDPNSFDEATRTVNLSNSCLILCCRPLFSFQLVSADILCNSK